MSNLRVGIVGAVSAYTLHYTAALRELPGVELVGLTHLGRSPRYIKEAWNLPWLTKYPKTMADYEAAYGVPTVESFEELLGLDVDAVCVTTEDYLHAYYAFKAIAAGKHVLLPKPFSADHQEAVELFAAADAMSVVLLGSLPNRFRPAYGLAAEVIQAGKIGRPISGHFSIEHHLSLGGWKSDYEMASGPEYEMGYYVFDAARQLMQSEPVTVMALAGNLDHQGIPYIDSGVALLGYASGAIASVDLRFSMHHRFNGHAGFEVVGDEGALKIEPDGALGIYTPAGVERIDLPVWDSTARELTTWLELCRGQGDAACWQREALATLDLISAFKCAYSSGAPVCMAAPAPCTCE